MPVANIDASIAILKHACSFQTFQHKVVGELQFYSFEKQQKSLYEVEQGYFEAEKNL